jgi:hypothetical protein
MVRVMNMTGFSSDDWICIWLQSLLITLITALSLIYAVYNQSALILLLLRADHTENTSRDNEPLMGCDVIEYARKYVYRAVA